MSTHQDIDREQRLFELVRDPLFVSARRRAARSSANRAGLELLGHDRGGAGLAPYVELLHPDDREAAGASWRRCWPHGGTTAPFRIRVLRPDGEMRWVETQSTLDAVSGLIYSVVHDVTDREEAFMDRLAGAFRDAPLGMALVAPGGAFLRVNSTLCRLLGPHRARAAGRERSPTCVEDERVAQALRDARAPSLQIETPLRHRDGRPVVALVSATLVRDSRGEPQYYVCQVLDMTERYEAQADLAANEAKLAEAQQIARMGSWEWEIASDRVTWSDELYRIYGVTAGRRSRAPTASYLDKVHADDRARVGARHRDGRDRAPAVEPRLPHRAPRRRAAHDPRARRGRARRARAPRGRARHLPGRHREPPRRGRAARRRAALPPRLRRRADRHGAHRPRRPLAAPEPRAVARCSAAASSSCARPSSTSSAIPRTAASTAR